MHGLQCRYTTPGQAEQARGQPDYDSDLIDGHRYKVKMEKLRAQLGAALTARARLAAGSGAGKLLVTDDPVAAFDAAPLGIKRAVLEFFITVRLLPASWPTRSRPGDGEDHLAGRISIEWQ